jgi:hypothetical protein
VVSNKLFNSLSKLPLQEIQNNNLSKSFKTTTSPRVLNSWRGVEFKTLHNKKSPFPKGKRLVYY